MNSDRTHPVDPTSSRSLSEWWASLSPRASSTVQAAVLCFVSILPFLPAVTGPYIFDDLTLVGRNPQVDSLDVWHRIWTTDLFDLPGDRGKQGSSYYRPIVTLSYALNWRASSGDPVAFHVVNLVLHAITTGLAFGFLRRVLGAGALAFWATVLFAIHPTKVESVAWISGRTDILCALFLLLSGKFLHLQLGARTTGGGRALALGKWAAAVLAFLSKETAVVLPAIFFAEAWAFAGKGRLSALVYHKSPVVRRVLPSILLVGVYVVLRLWLMPITRSTPFGGPWHQLSTALATLGENARLLFFPRDLALYANRIEVLAGHFHVETSCIAVGVLCMVGLLSTFLFGLRRAPTVAVLAACFLVFIAPTSQLIGTGLRYLTQARFLYLPLLALAPLVLWPVRRRSGALHLLGALLAVACFIRSATRSVDFSTEERFWEAELRSNPRAPEVLLPRLRGDVRLRGRTFAIRRALCAATFADARYGGQDVSRFVLFALVESTSVLPDGHPSLQQAADFVRVARTGAAATFLGPVELVMADRAARDVARNPNSALEVEARLRARIGQTKEAFRLAEQMVQSCPSCVEHHRSLAKMAVLYGDEASLSALSTGLDAEEVAELTRALRKRQAAEQQKGPARAWQLLQLGLSIEQYGFAYRQVVQQLDVISAHASDNVLIGVAQAAMFSGERETGMQLFFRLPPEARRNLLDRDWPLAPSEGDSEFVPGTCALPSEL